MQRQIVLDTETTGLKVSEGHRIIEIGCLEMVGRKLTGKKFHYYLNPQREVDPGALAVHGLSTDFLKDKPLFSDIAEEWINFVKDAELIIHNAVFDTSFLNHELTLLNKNLSRVEDYCQVTDTLLIARKKHVGQRNNLDALCKRYKIDNNLRNLHGALLDASLLAQVYLAMTGGQGSFFDNFNEDFEGLTQNNFSDKKTSKRVNNIFILKALQNEIEAHEAYLDSMVKKGKCIWLEYKETN